MAHHKKPVSAAAANPFPLHVLHSFSLEQEIYTHIEALASPTDFLVWLRGVSVTFESGHYLTLFERLSGWLTPPLPHPDTPVRPVAHGVSAQAAAHHPASAPAIDTTESRTTQVQLGGDITFWLWLQSFFADVLCHRFSSSSSLQDEDLRLFAATAGFVKLLAGNPSPPHAHAHAHLPSTHAHALGLPPIRPLLNPTSHCTHNVAELCTYGVCPALLGIIRALATHAGTLHSNNFLHLTAMPLVAGTAPKGALAAVAVQEALLALINVATIPTAKKARRTHSHASSPSSSPTHAKTPTHDRTSGPRSSPHAAPPPHHHHNHSDYSSSPPASSSANPQADQDTPNPAHALLAKLPSPPFDALYLALRAHRRDPYVTDLAFRAIAVRLSM